MERFAKRKVIILPSRSGNKLAFFKEDSGNKHFVGEYSRYMADSSICEDVKEWVKKHEDNM